MACSADNDDQLQLISADELTEPANQGIDRQVSSHSTESQPSGDDDSDQLKGVALEDYDPVDEDGIELARGDIVFIREQTLDKQWYVVFNTRTREEGQVPFNSVTHECNELEPIPQQSNLRRGVVLRRKKGNRDSGRRSGTLVDAASLPPLPSSTATAAPSLVEMRAGRSATLRPTPTAVPLESANQRDLVKSELFVGKTVPVEYKLIEKHNIISVSGADKYGRPVISMAACRLPPSYQISHDRLLEYLKYRLDQYVESDYIVVYFHHGFNSTNKPSYSWLWQAHKELERKYKKNIKKLYIVHPTNFIKIVSTILKPYISYKFGKKVTFVNRVAELEQVLYLGQIDIPDQVMRYDMTLRTPPRPIQQMENRSSFYMPLEEDMPFDASKPQNTEVFGVSIEELHQRTGSEIPLVMKKSIEYILEEGLSTVGIFRRTPSQYTLQQIKKRFNVGEDVDFNEYGDPHLAAVTLKLFLRELPEPVLSFPSYDNITLIKTLPEEQRIPQCCKVINELPPLNYSVVKYLFDFIVKVSSYEEVNKMSPANLSIVFGPNLLWSKDQVATLNSMNDINRFTLILINRYSELFTR